MAQLDADMGERVCTAMGDMGIDVQTEPAGARDRGGRRRRGRAVRTDAGSYPADLVVLGLGMGPEVALAREAGLQLGTTGAIDVDRTQRSRSHPEVFAAGDCAQTFHRITGEAIHVALGTHANKQGRVAGSVIGGRPARFAGVLGTAMTKVGDLEIARTGLCTTQAEDGGYDFRTETDRGDDAGRLLPGRRRRSRSSCISERGSGLLLGAQVVGGPGSGKRIDVFATAIWAGMTAEELAGSDLSYAPPFSPDLRPGARRRPGGQPRRAGLSGGPTETEVRQRRLVRRGPLRSGAHRGRVQSASTSPRPPTRAPSSPSARFRDCRFNLSRHTERRLPELHLHRVLVLPGGPSPTASSSAAPSSAARST